MVIGSVSVGVDPDARGWSAKLRSQILPGSDAVGRDIGQHIGDSAGVEARRRISLALRDLKATVNVDADTGKARTEIAALRREVNKPATGPGLLLTAITALGPALVPLAGIAAVSFGALAEGAGVALLAVKGVQQQMAEGTQLGRAYSAGLTTLKSDFQKLSTVAAQGVFQGFASSVRSVSGLMPQLSQTTRLFANALGEAAGHIVHGLLQGFVKLQPAMNSVLGIVTSLAAKFDTFASGGGLEKFGTWVQANLPAIEHDIAAVAQVLTKIVTAAAPIGVTVLNAIGALADAINRIPVGTLRVILELTIATLLAWKGYSIIGGIIGKATGALAAYSVTAAEAAASTNLLAAALTAVIVSGIAINDFNKKLPGALQQTASTALAGVAPGLSKQLAPTATPVGTQIPINVTQKATAANTQLAAALGTTKDAYYQASLAVKKNAEAQQEQTREMQLANDAAGLLSQALNKLGGNNLGVAEATVQNSQATRDATAALKANGTTLSLNTDKGLANRKALDQSASSAIALAGAVAKQTGSTTRSNQSLATSKRRLEDSLASQGKLTPAIQRYIDTIFKIPARKATAVDVNIAAAAAAVARIKSLMAAIYDVTRHVYIQTVYSKSGPAQFRQHGGPVTAGMPYWVGENRRPELFIPDRSGQIVPENQIRSVGGGAGMSARGIAAAVAGALSGARFEFDGDGLARLVTSRQNAYAAKGPRR